MPEIGKYQFPPKSPPIRLARIVRTNVSSSGERGSDSSSIVEKRSETQTPAKKIARPDRKPVIAKIPCRISLESMLLNSEIEAYNEREMNPQPDANSIFLQLPYVGAPLRTRKEPIKAAANQRSAPEIES